MKYERTPISIRSLAPKLIESGGPSPINSTIPERIANIVDCLPFNIKDISPIASTGERADREVVVFAVSLSDGQTAVIKVGRTYDIPQHGEPQDRALHELRSTQMFQESPLAPYVIPTFSLFAGKEDEVVDVRVQRQYVKGTQLADVDLGTLSPCHIDTLIQYHKTLLATVIKCGLYPETGIAIQTETNIKSLLTKFIRLIPLVSENVLFDKESNTVSIVDTGHPYNFSNHNEPSRSKAGGASLQESSSVAGSSPLQTDGVFRVKNKGVKQKIKKLFTATLILGEIGLLYGLKGYKTVMSE